MQTPKLIFFDIDDTLYDKNTASIPPSVWTAFRQLTAQNINIAIATGRGIGIFPDGIKTLIEKIGIRHLVTINGQLVLSNQACIAHYPLTNTQIQTAIRCFNANQMAYGIMMAQQLYAVGHSQYLALALNSLNIAYQSIDVDTFDFEMPVYQLLAFCENNRMMDWQLSNELKIIHWHKHGSDILDKEGTKLRGIKALLTHLNISLDACMAFGDGSNDLEMIQAVGFGVAMGNACQELKAVADMIAPNIDDDGIYKALAVLGLIDDELGLLNT